MQRTTFKHQVCSDWDIQQFNYEKIYLLTKLKDFFFILNKVKAL